MIFNSYIFWFFFAVVLFVYWKLPLKQQNRFLLVASYFFYGYWDWRFLGLLAFSSTVDFYLAQRVHRSSNVSSRNRFVLISVVTNLTLLGFFKYYNFFSAELIHALTELGVSFYLPTLKIILPVGLSFYTFQSMSYTIDVYRKQLEPAKNLFDYMAYVSFFPQLVAGPIERASNLLPQFLIPRKRLPGDIATGLYHVLLGLFKKVIIADNLAPIVNAVFTKNSHDLSGAEVLAGVYAFAIQIYCDFSGYSSVAQGVAKWLGFDLMWNFKMPYFAVSPSDFWKRWHISLSSWLRDYLYIPLGGNRKGNISTYKNLLITMLLGGLWHGARWTFVFWGLFHGIIQVIFRVFERKKGKSSHQSHIVIHLIKIVVMFHLICISWLFFRADTLSQVWMMCIDLFTDFRVTPFALYSFGMVILFGAPLLIHDLVVEKNKDLLCIVKGHYLWRVLAYSYVMIMLWVFTPLLAQVFIYFQF
jgi:D-alanyl-lipoteichoic acid acyltransferase DltB (MBOAT superfamily)